MTTVRSREPQTTPNLLREIVQESLFLIRTEGELARVEISANIREALRNVAGLLIGAVFLIAALTVGLQALSHGLVHGLQIPLWVGYLLSALVAGIIGLSLLMKAKNALEPESLAPTRTMKNIKRDTEIAKEAVK